MPTSTGRISGPSQPLQLNGTVEAPAAQSGSSMNSTLILGLATGGGFVLLVFLLALAYQRYNRNVTPQEKNEEEEEFSTKLIS